MSAWNANFYPSSYTVETAEQLRGHNREHYQYDPKPLGEILIEAGIITPKQLKDAMVTQSHTEDMRIGEALACNGAVRPEQVCLALCARFGLPFVKLRAFEIEPAVMVLIPSHVARRYKVMPLIEDQEKVVVAVSDPTDLELINTLRFMTHKVLEVAVALPEDIAFAISMYYERAELSETMEPLLVEPLKNSANEVESLIEQQSNGQATVQLVQSLVTDALVRKASSIHIRPEQNDVNVYYRVGGALQWVRRFSKQLLPAVSRRIKTLADMEPSERRLPQNGGARIEFLGKWVGGSVSVIPALFGESIVINLHDADFVKRDFNALGFSDAGAAYLRRMLTTKRGLVLVAGPPCSGKSTTLYTALAHVRETAISIMTVEDPIEHYLDGLTQVQVDRPAGYNSVEALQHVLQHDPDVIMLGEIRDLATAKMAIESASTGCLVISSMQASSAASAVARLVEMGVEPYLLRSNLVGVLAQNLVQCNCPDCLQSENVEVDASDQFKLELNEQFFKGAGCDACQNSGVVGQQLVYELLTVTPAIQGLIKEGVKVSAIQAQAELEGLQPLATQALELARSQRVPLSEVCRVHVDE